MSSASTSLWWGWLRQSGARCNLFLLTLILGDGQFNSLAVHSRWYPLTLALMCVQVPAVGVPAQPHTARDASQATSSRVAVKLRAHAAISRIRDAPNLVLACGARHHSLLDSSKLIAQRQSP